MKPSVSNEKITAVVTSKNKVFCLDTKVNKHQKVNKESSLHEPFEHSVMPEDVSGERDDRSHQVRKRNEQRVNWNKFGNKSAGKNKACIQKEKALNRRKFQIFILGKKAHGWCEQGDELCTGCC